MHEINFCYLTTVQCYSYIGFSHTYIPVSDFILSCSQAFRRVHFPGLPSVSSRASTSHSNRSSESTESTNTTFEPESYEPYLKRMAGRLGPTWQLFLRRFDEVSYDIVR